MASDGGPKRVQFPHHALSEDYVTAWNAKRMGAKGGKASMAKLTPRQRKNKARKAALARWRKRDSA